ncbi:MAG: hypothetical protein C0397_19915, partial [Odoribacter sp.]|nr:hypothetical protein [Odoribacter sp.]
KRRIGFIRILAFYLQFQNPLDRKTFLDIYDHKEDAKINDAYFKNQASYICSQTKGITRDLCLHFFALYNLDMLPSKSKEIYTSISGLIDERYVKEQFKKRFNSKLEKIKPQIEKINSNETTALDSLISKYPGKVIYVDFWAPWCGPCMDEMPDSKRLKESYHGKEVVFVYLACDCSEKSWKSTIATKDINGINLLLSNSDYEILKRRFEIPGIPYFLLINKKGEVVNKNAPRPSDGNIKSEIAKLL